jgi:hypothetical protein
MGRCSKFLFLTAVALFAYIQGCVTLNTAEENESEVIIPSGSIVEVQRNAAPGTYYDMNGNLGNLYDGLDTKSKSGEDDFTAIKRKLQSQKHPLNSEADIAEQELIKLREAERLSAQSPVTEKPSIETEIPEEIPSEVMKSVSDEYEDEDVNWNGLNK